jgi:hypothetical protein
MEEFFVVLVDFVALFEFVIFVKNGLMEEFSINYFYFYKSTNTTITG